MDFTTYRIEVMGDSLVVEHTLCSTRIMGWDPDVYATTLSAVMQNATQHNARCSALQRVR